MSFNIFSKLIVVFFFILIFLYFVSDFFEHFEHIDKQSKISHHISNRHVDIMNDFSNISIKQKVGQMIITVPEGLFLSDFEKKQLQKSELGGFFLLKKNIRDPNQLSKLISEIASASAEANIKPFIAIDQEGGEVNRIPWIAGIPQDEIDDLDQSFNIAYNRGIELKKIGINMNFAPVTEIAYNKNSFIKKQHRSFPFNCSSKNCDQYLIKHSQLLEQNILGYNNSGIIPVIKHFPGGLGIIDIDPHNYLPELDLSLNQLSNELRLYKKMILDGIDALMITHLVYPKIDTVMSSRSKIIINDLLRKDLNYSKVIIIDDLMMKAVTSRDDTLNFSIDSINAGADILLISDNFEAKKIFDNLVSAVESKKISQNRLNKSFLRVMVLKNKLNPYKTLNK